MGRTVEPNSIINKNYYNPQGFTENRALLGVPYLGVYGAGIQKVFFNTSTFVVPPNVTSIRVHLWGAGGGGGYHGNTSANYKSVGGAGGGYSQKTISVVPGASYTVTIGAAGAKAAVSTTGNNGSAGGTTSFGSVFSATGGGGGFSNSTTRSVGGSGSGGDLNYTGGGGGMVTTNQNHGGPGGGSAATALGNGGNGGDWSVTSGEVTYMYGTAGGGIGGNGGPVTTFGMQSYPGTCIADGGQTPGPAINGQTVSYTVTNSVFTPYIPWSVYSPRWTTEFFTGGSGLNGAYYTPTGNVAFAIDSGPGVGGYCSYAYVNASNVYGSISKAGTCGGGGGAMAYIYSAGNLAWNASAGDGGLAGGGGGAGGQHWKASGSYESSAAGNGGPGFAVIEW